MKGLNQEKCKLLKDAKRDEKKLKYQKQVYCEWLD